MGIWGWGLGIGDGVRWRKMGCAEDAWAGNGGWGHSGNGGWEYFGIRAWEHPGDLPPCPPQVVIVINSSAPPQSLQNELKPEEIEQLKVGRGLCRGWGGFGGLREGLSPPLCPRCA